MKLIIQIPCYNEEKTLGMTLDDLPGEIHGIDQIETLVIDDGSTDQTIKVAREHGVDHIVHLTNNKGLATGFVVGLDSALKLGADIIVNTDGDNQYFGKDIPKLVQPILEGKADIVIGARDIDEIEHFSFLKKKLQKVGSWVVRHISYTDVSDTTSGFRAFSREAAIQLNVVSEFTYTLETLIQAGKKNIPIQSVPIRTNRKTRDSHLFSSMWRYIYRSVSTLIRIYTMYRPLRAFSYIGGTVFLAGLGVGLRFIYFFSIGDGAGHVQSLILSAVLLIVGFQLVMIGLVADTISANRRLIEDSLYRIRKMELTGGAGMRGHGAEATDSGESSLGEIGVEEKSCWKS
jgi:glycosyltransferase involved in cell wall biosynthesis